MNLPCPFFSKVETWLLEIVTTMVWTTPRARHVKCEVKWEVSLWTKRVEVMEFQLSYFKPSTMMLWKCHIQYASKSGKLCIHHRTGKGQFPFQSQRNTMPKNVQTIAQLHSSQFSSVQLLSRVRLFAAPWTTAHQASLSITNSWSSPKLVCIVFRSK